MIERAHPDRHALRRGHASELMDTLSLYRWKDALGPLARDPAEIVWT